MKEGNNYIIVMQNGFVHIGNYAGKTKDGGIVLCNSAVIRRWGTKKGLGEIALCGLQKETILDKEGDICLNPAYKIRHIPVLAHVEY